MGFKENLKDELIYQDISTKELSAKTNISMNTLNHYLKTNGATPSVENAVKIARSLGVSVEYLVTGKNSKIADELPEKIITLTNKMRFLQETDLNLLEEIIMRLGK